ncbi:undecaprenyl-phosphate glucose phosphotransferase [Blastochloris tepida]|uniref:Undecaprenyl-phosphate glucose phosphotransferase n=1 Tax=Blastochloris tepida TaxID=2233851 RepID=A0A348FZX9_9HYPH|nr:undecaprenyl-phosphate glucose phosphotransferase [Blastochloris tepida]BBF92862.1 undecaprenyl-phosphate glucose phosphotransferase [Blastochloris tepida]
MMVAVSDTLRSTASAPPAQRQRLGIAFSAVEPVVATVDALIIVVAGVLGGALYHLATTGNAGELLPYAGLGLIGSLAYGLAANRFELYRLQRLVQRDRDYSQIAVCWLWSMLVISITLFLLKRGDDVSRGSVLCFAGIGVLVLLTWRAVVRQWLLRAVARGAIHGQRVVVLGTDDEFAAGGSRNLMILGGLDVVGRVVLPRVGDAAGRQRQAAAVKQAIRHARKARAEAIVLALPWGDAAQLEFVRERLRASPLPVRLLPDSSMQSILRHRNWGTHQSLLVEIQRAPLSTSEQAAKRILDIAVAVSALAALMPLMLAVAALIRLQSRGPAIFRQRRNGFNGKEFVIYKFRTMTVMEDGPTLVQARRSDNRVTRIGRILRQTSIDELPQLFNVLRGDMSIVGPRPHALAHDDEYSRLIANYAFRHHVKPGITGWAQVHGHRGGTPRLEQMAKRIELDLWYINNWSLALDLQILARTAFELFRSHNAY